MSETKTRPEFCTDAMLEYLDDLRESGEVNMFGAGAFLAEEFPEIATQQRSYQSDPRVHAVLAYWMETFGKETR